MSREIIPLLAKLTWQMKLFSGLIITHMVRDFFDMNFNLLSNLSFNSLLHFSHDRQHICTITQLLQVELALKSLVLKHQDKLIQSIGEKSKIMKQG